MKRYYTLREYLNEVLSRAMKDPKWEEAAASSSLDCCSFEATYSYCAELPDGKNSKIRSCAFDIIPKVTMGGNDAVYAAIMFCGRSFDPDVRREHEVMTLKTLNRRKDVFLAMHELGGLIAWYGIEVMKENLHRFD